MMKTSPLINFAIPLTSLKRQLALTLAAFLLIFRASAQAPIDVTESTLKVRGLSEEVFYYGFAEGDQIVFSFQEVDGRELKEVEIIELPSSSKFMDYKTTSIQNKVVNVNRTGIYKFRFSNSALKGRICKFKVQRVPGSEATKSFNTSVYWHTIYDTTYSTEQERYLVKSDTGIFNFIHSNVKVHSSSNPAGNKTVFPISLPEHTICWSYYIGVNQKGAQAFEKATHDFTKAASPIVAEIPGYGPMAVLALNGVSYFASIQGGEAINFSIADVNNTNLFQQGQQYFPIKNSRVINDFSQMRSPVRGNYYFCFLNENTLMGVDVLVQATAITVNSEWGMRPITKMHVTSHERAYLKN